MRTLMAVALLLCSTLARSEDLYCPGKIAQLIVYGAGQLSIVGTWRGQWTHLCNLKTGNPVDSVTCSNWAAMATMAFKEGSLVGVYYNVPAGTTCANLATGANAPVPVYFRLYAPQ
jgi:hypothetical protein